MPQGRALTTLFAPSLPPLGPALWPVGYGRRMVNARQKARALAEEDSVTQRVDGCAVAAECNYSVREAAGSKSVDDEPPKMARQGLPEQGNGESAGKRRKVPARTTQKWVWTIPGRQETIPCAGACQRIFLAPRWGLGVLSQSATSVAGRPRQAGTGRPRSMCAAAQSAEKPQGNGMPGT